MMGQILTMKMHNTNKRTILITIPCLKNSPVVNCFDSYAMAFGAAPIRRKNGIPAVTNDA